MDSITKQLKSIIKEAILAEMFIKNFDELHREIDNKRNQMDDVQEQQLLSLLSIAISEFDRKNNLLNSKINQAEDSSRS
jgi:hypothetical protein